MNDLIQKYNLGVEKNNEWDKMNSDEPHEHVDLLLHVVTPAVLIAIIGVIQTKIKQGTLKGVHIELPNKSITLEEATREDMEYIMKASGFSTHSIDAPVIRKSCWRRILFWKK